jgi:asparaginyl-tRNA synthetase
MIPKHLLSDIHESDHKFKDLDKKLFILPEYKPETHYIELTRSKYFEGLIVLRHYLKVISDYYFSIECGAKNIDLFMLTPSISSPMGPGSNSESIPIKFGEYSSYLVDSSQFGFEPVLMNGIDILYCYLPSMRGENPDFRHLNQFFHCEAEMIGSIDKLIPIVEKYVKTLSSVLLSMPNILERLSMNYDNTKLILKKLVDKDDFPVITFDEAISKLVDSNNENLINFTEKGRDISSLGELKLAEILNYGTPFWIINYDRDRVPFYQKPLRENPDRVINRDLIFPPIIAGSFGGEIVGAGQRQDNIEEIQESISRQNINSEPYDWYINLRKLPGYKTTSGFGLGIERFITWALCRSDIKDSIPYPRLKNIRTFP